MRRIRWRALVIGGLAAAVGLVVAGTPRAMAGTSGVSGPADPVLVWSGYAEQAAVTGRPPGSSAVLLGIVHVGMYDTPMGRPGAPL